MCNQGYDTYSVTKERNENSPLAAQARKRSDSLVKPTSWRTLVLSGPNGLREPNEDCI
jgi:hypothetical protein